MIDDDKDIKLYLILWFVRLCCRTYCICMRFL